MGQETFYGGARAPGYTEYPTLVQRVAATDGREVAPGPEEAIWGGRAQLDWASRSVSRLAEGLHARRARTGGGNIVPNFGGFGFRGLSRIRSG
jgi:hypothetical protein